MTNETGQSQGGTSQATAHQRISTFVPPAPSQLLDGAVSALDELGDALVKMGEAHENARQYQNVVAHKVGTLNTILLRLKHQLAGAETEGGTNTEVRHARSESGAAPSVEGPHKSRPGPER